MKKCLFLCLSLLLIPVLALCEPRAVLFTATDLHYIAPTLTDNGALFTDLIEQGDGKAMAYSDALIEAFIAQVIAEKPDALILSGDLTFNGARESHEALSLRLARIRDAGIPVFVLPGNHDLNSSSAARFEGDGYTRVDGVTAGEFAALYHAFGFDGALSRDADSLSYVAALSDDLRLLMLDVNTSAAPNAVLKGTLSWARRQLMQAQADGCRIIAVSHQNLIDHSGLLSSGFTIRNADALRRLYAVSPVLCNLSGHIRLVAGRFAESIRRADADGGRADLPHRARPRFRLGGGAGAFRPQSAGFFRLFRGFFPRLLSPSGARRHRRGRCARAVGRFLRRGQRRVFFRPHGYPRAGFRA